MKRKDRYIVRPDEVIITREGDAAVIQYKEVGVPATELVIGSLITAMTDEEIVELFNETLRAQAKLASEYKHVAVEVPLGSPQIKYFAAGEQWSPRGGVLRCLIDDDHDGLAVIQIDDKELQIEEFGRLLRTYAGWACESNSCRRTRFTVAQPWRSVSQTRIDQRPSKLLCSQPRQAEREGSAKRITPSLSLTSMFAQHC